MAKISNRKIRKNCPGMNQIITEGMMIFHAKYGPAMTLLTKKDVGNGNVWKKCNVRELRRIGLNGLLKSSNRHTYV